jgi:hypothetical protein
MKGGSTPGVRYHHRRDICGRPRRHIGSPFIYRSTSAACRLKDK